MCVYNQVSSHKNARYDPVSDSSNSDVELCAASVRKSTALVWCSGPRCSGLVFWSTLFWSKMFWSKMFWSGVLVHVVLVYVVLVYVVLV